MLKTEELDKSRLMQEIVIYADKFSVERVIDIKTILEDIREQVQNIE